MAHICPRTRLRLHHRLSVIQCFGISGRGSLELHSYHYSKPQPTCLTLRYITTMIFLGTAGVHGIFHPALYHRSDVRKKGNRE